VEHDHSAHENTGYGIYVVTWLALLGLTAITVTVAGMAFGKLSVLVALSIAVVKASVVLAFFMHLKHEKPVFRTMLYACLITYGIFIGLTFFDPLFR
jgi:cytochrome c oxidase subunit 4